MFQRFGPCLQRHYEFTIWSKLFRPGAIPETSSDRVQTSPNFDQMIVAESDLGKNTLNLLSLAPYRGSSKPTFLIYDLKVNQLVAEPNQCCEKNKDDGNQPTDTEQK